MLIVLPVCVHRHRNPVSPTRRLWPIISVPMVPTALLEFVPVVLASITESVAAVHSLRIALPISAPEIHALRVVLVDHADSIQIARLVSVRVTHVCHTGQAGFARPPLTAPLVVAPVDPVPLTPVPNSARQTMTVSPTAVAPANVTNPCALHDFFLLLLLARMYPPLNFLV